MSISFPSTESPRIYAATLSEDFPMLNSSSNFTEHDFTKQTIVPILYVVITIIGVIGNGVVLYIMQKMISSKSVTDVYVSNLAIADLLLVCTLPFWTIDLIMEEWKFGLFLCKVISGASYLNIYASVFFLTSMSLDRWFAVVKAVKSRKYRTVRNARIICRFIWIIGLFFIVLPLLYRSTKLLPDKREVCTWDFPHDLALSLNIIYSILRSVFGFLFPLLVIVFCYFDLIVYIHKRNEERRRKSSKRSDRVSAMVLVVISCFIICWMPNQITNFVIFLIHSQVINCDSQSSAADQDDIRIRLENSTTYPYNNQVLTQVSGIPLLMKLSGDYRSKDDMTAINRVADVSNSFICGSTFVDFHFITVCLGFSNSMMNPIVYSFMGAKFRKKLKLLLSCKSRRQRSGSKSTGPSFWTSLNYSAIRRICERAIGRNSVTVFDRPKTPSSCVRNKISEVSSESIPLRQMTHERVSRKCSLEAINSEPLSNDEVGLFDEVVNRRLLPPSGSNRSSRFDEKRSDDFQLDESLLPGEESNAVNHKLLIIPDGRKKMWISATTIPGVTL